MAPKKQKGSNSHSKNKADSNEECATIINDTNQIISNRQQLSRTSVEGTPDTPVGEIQQVQMIKVNGQYYAPVQQEQFNYQNKINKQFSNPSSQTNRMSQTTNNKLDYMYDNSSITPDSYHHLQNNSISTPKRNADQLNRSNEQTKKARHGDLKQQNNQQQQALPKSPKINSTSQNQASNNGNTGKSNYGTSAITTTNEINNNKQYSFPLDQLKRAVDSTLPCFMIDFDRTIVPRELPSAIIACDIIKQHFDKNNIKIEAFSVAAITGHRLKLGVNNMEDYSKLILMDKWPTSINKKKIEIIKPKFVPECFTLVVRYISQELSIQTVIDEVKRSISSADNFKQIKYSFNRPTKDIRFTVADLREYEGALKLGKLAVANRLYPITKYLPSNKLTFCTNCWQIGHLRHSCKSNLRKCRICLEAFDNDHNNKCSGKPLCAQCGLEHHSLDPTCEVIQKYRQKLNQEVKQAVQDGAINRKCIQVHQQQERVLLLSRPTCENDYPFLPNHNNINNVSATGNYGWFQNNPRSISNNNDYNNMTITSMLNKIKQELKEEIHSMKEVILNKIDDKINKNTSNIQLHQVSLGTINSTIAKIFQQLLLPIMNHIPDTDFEFKQQMLVTMQEIQKPFYIQADNLRLSFNYGNHTDETHKTVSSSQSNMINNDQSSAPPPSSYDTPTLIEECDRMVDTN